MKRLISLFLSITLLLSLCAMSVSADNGIDDYGDFSYYLNSDNNAVIVRYSGDSTEVVFPDRVGDYTVTGLGDYILYDTKITAITLPESLQSIADHFFDNAAGLRSISISAAAKNFACVDGVLYTADMKTLVRCPAAYEKTTFTIPDGVETLGRDAFKSVQIKEFTFPTSLSSIKSGALINTPWWQYACDYAKKNSVYIVNNMLIKCYSSDNTGFVLPSVELICENAMSDYRGSSVYLPSTASLAEHAFYNNKTIQYIEVGSNAKYIDRYSFEGCIGLNTLVIGGMKTQVDLTSLGCWTDRGDAITRQHIETGKLITEINELPFSDWKGTLYYRGENEQLAATLDSSVKTNAATLLSGDAMLDGKRDGKDILGLRKLLAYYPVFVCNAAADVDKNGTINALDLLMLRQLYAGIITE